MEGRDERDEPEHADEARRGRERQQPVPLEQRLEEDVVEREGDRRAEDDQRPLRVGERELAARAEEDDDGDAGKGDREPGDPARPGASRPSAAASRSVSAGERATTSAAVPEVVYFVPMFRDTW